MDWNPLDASINFTLMTAPYNYITYQARSLDGRTHEVQLYLEATPQSVSYTHLNYRIKD